MRKTLGITLTAAALMLGGAGIANATPSSAPMPSSTTSTLADDSQNNQYQDNDKTGLWGLLGLLGLVGLAGRKRHDTTVASGSRDTNAVRH